MVIRKDNIVEALKLFTEHFDIEQDELMHNFILSQDLLDLWHGKYSSIPDPLYIYIKRGAYVNGFDPLKYRKLIGLFTGETIANYGGIVEIKVQINGFTFVVKPQQPEDERSDVRDSIAAVIGNGPGDQFWKI